MEQKADKPEGTGLAGRLLDETRQLALSLERMPLGYIVWNAQYRVLDWNPAAEKIFGWSLAEAQGRSVSELMLPGYGVPPECLRRAAEQGDKTVETVCAGVNKNGRRVVCEWHNTPVRDADGALSAMISMVHDITDRDEADRELRGNRKFLQTIIDSEPECVKLLDAKAGLIMMNRAGLDMIQADSMEQVQGQSVCPLVTSEYRDAFMKLINDVFEGKSGSVTFEITGLRGRKLWLETHAVPLRNDKDEIIALLGITRDVTERIENEQILKHERDFTSAVLDTVKSIVLVLDREGRVMRFNRMCEELSGYSAGEILGKNVWDLFIPLEQVAEVKAAFGRTVAGTYPLRYETTWVTKDRSRRLIAWSHTALPASDGAVEFVIATGIDMTDRKRLEDQLRQSQKMESIGTLAGGIAHDFNNILTAIIGYASLLQMKTREGDPLRHSVEQILSSANRAATLTQGLLAYSRKQILNAQPLNVNDVIRKVEILLRRLIGEDIELTALLTDRNVTVLADAGQLEQVLMNLATNARDAMPDGGKLYIETEQVVLDEQSAALHEFNRPGAYAVISVTDSGSGMDEKTKERIFDPFFTTKEVGKGTGLGLAMAYGIVKQHNGAIVVSSEVGRGSTFRIYLPLVPTAQKRALPAGLPDILGGSETVLLAEDDAVVRELTSHVLQQFGYRVIEATDGEDAVNKFMQNRGQVKLLLLDVIMPKKNGKEVYGKISIFEPGIKALFLSGYTADIMQQKGLIDPGFSFIMKPVPVNELLRRIRAMLDDNRP